MPGDAIVMTLWRRPDYARRVLEALRACDGIADYLLLPHVEPGDDETRALVEAIDFVECLPTWNPARLGCAPNAEAAFRHGFARAEFVIFLEEDIVLAPDALRFFAWCRDRYRDDPGVFSATAYNRLPGPVPAEGHHRVRRRSWYHAWGSATWKDRFRRFDGVIGTRPSGWDGRLKAAFIDGGRERLQEVFPELSRCDNIGLRTTVQDASRFTPEWYAEHHSLRHWAGTHDVGPGRFHE